MKIANLIKIVIAILTLHYLAACKSTIERDLLTPPVSSDNQDSGDEEESYPDDGVTIMGAVRSSYGTRLKGVVVSDGTEVVLTDENGEYRIRSDKSNGFVFVSIPGNYTVYTEGNRPVFYHNLTGPADQLEIHNFNLSPVDNTSYTLLIHADQHLANRTDDLAQLNRNVLPDMNDFIRSEFSKGKNVYSLSLGDISWDQFWRANSFDIVDAAKSLGPLECMLFHSIGNHDNNPYVSDDWMSSAFFRHNIAPTYYSFNIGEVHYVMLDNIIYNNPDATDSEMGKRTYDRALTQSQLDWLKKDLEVLPDKDSPIVICGHVPFYSEPGIKNNEQTTGRNMLNMEDLEQILSPYPNVTLFSGHYHRNFNVRSPFLNGVEEHNVASLSGSLWWTACPGYSVNHICTDGSPGGYGLLRVDGRNLDYKYKGVGMDEDYQFRVYDLNCTLINEDCVSGSNKYKEMVKDYAGEYYNKNSNNDVLVNVFSFQPDWKIEIFEEGSPLTVTRVKTKDPLHILSYECQRLSHNGVPNSTSTFTTQNSNHFFKARCKSATTTVKVVVTDRNGKQYVQTVSRPKYFNESMR